jgi:Rieske 2Fe-2S family protein
MAHVTYDGDGTEKGVEQYNRLYDSWAQRAKALGRKVGYLDPPCPDQTLRASRQVIKEGSLSTTQGGEAACEVLLGDVKEHDGGTSSLVFGDNLFLLAANDYITLLHFNPLDEMNTDVTLIYLVNGEAEEGRDYDVDAITWLWDVTTEQDAKIIIDNQKGILSERYQPGPYSVLEGYCNEFIRDYLKLLATERRPTTVMAVDPADYTHETMWVANV